MDDQEHHDESTYPEVISAYSRAQAIDDGVLVDVSQPARETGFRHPVALTRAAWDRCIGLTPAAERAGCDERGRLHDLLWVLYCTIRRSRGGPELAFDLLCVVNSLRPLSVPLRAVVGPGDHGEPVITVMLVGES
jgi:hypothetical protein